MTGLLPHSRDSRIPALAGEPELAPPDADEFRERFVPLLLPEFERSKVELLYARWKPGVSTTACYRVSEAGSAELVVWRRHLDGKWDAGDADRLGKGRLGDGSGSELRWHVDPANGVLAHVFPADPDLPGAVRVRDVGRFARWFESQGVAPGRRVRRKHFASRLVRYRPSSRAVLRFDVRLMTADGAKERTSLGVRCLEPRRATDVMRKPRAFGANCSDDLFPPTIGVEERTGVLYERWLDVEPRVHDDYDAPEVAGALLARVHRTPVAVDPSLARTAPRFDPSPWFAPFERLRAARWPELASAARTWTHGDFHPDCVATARDGSGVRLLDADSVAVGEPLEDVADWVAGDVAASGASFEESARAFLEGYDGAVRFELRELAPFVVRALVARAAAAVRRLEVDAVERASRLLDRSASVREEVGR
ncbi:MAG: hypothetical protein R3F34_03390 [Planctomycetota bacterium]